jgi:hypothetical protein
MVEDMLGQPVDWNVLDWPIPANSLVLENATPYSAAKSVADVIGAVILSNKDGSLRVQYQYPHAMNQLSTAPIAHDFTDLDDNLSVSTEYLERGGFNFYRILSGQSTFADRLEWVPEEEDPTTGVLRLYLSPWRDSYKLIYTGGDATISKFGEAERVETEVVEFAEGVASTRYPVFEVETVNWLADPLGAVTHELSSTTLNSGVGVNFGYSVAEITYKTRTVNYGVNGDIGDYAQFIVEDEG